MVGISIVVPKAASAIEIGHSKNKFSSDLLNSSWDLTLMNKYKSPLAPPLVPASPLPDNLIRVPSSTPWGIVTANFLDVCLFPWPLQSLHGCVISSPLPAHCGQVCWTVKKPWLVLTLPFPPQYVHLSGEWPGFDPLPLHVLHFSEVENWIFCFFPEYASSSVIDKSYLKSDPLLLELLLLLLLPPPPKSPKKSSKISEKSDPLKPPKPPKPP